MLIEFFGLPGSGKSTLACAVVERLACDGIAVASPTYALDHETSPGSRRAAKGLLAAQFLVTSPLSTAAYLRQIAATRPAGVGDFVRITLNLCMVSALATNARAGGCTSILDQGLAQALWSIGFTATAADWTAPIGAMLLPVVPDLVVHVAAEPATVATRLALRTDHASRLNTQHTDAAAMTKAVAVETAVARMLRDRLVPTLPHRNDRPGDIAEGARRVAAIVRSAVPVRAAAAAAHRTAWTAAVAPRGTEAHDHDR